MKKYYVTILFAVTLFCLLGPLSSLADACPMCRNANETDNLLPRAYMYSIIFMISMPAMIFTGFSIAFYRLHKKAQLAEPRELHLPDDDNHNRETT